MIDPIKEMQADWRNQTIELETVRRSFHRWRFRTYAMIALDVVCVLVALVAGIAFALAGLKAHDLFLGLSSLILLLACPLFVFWIVRARRIGLNWTNMTPEGTLRFALSRSTAVATILKVGYWNGLALLVFVGLVWACALAGLISHLYPLVFMSIVWVVVASAAIIWTRWRRMINARERLRCEQLLAVFERAKRPEA